MNPVAAAPSPVSSTAGGNPCPVPSLLLTLSFQGKMGVMLP
jgi:hypothetical protein